MPTLELEYDNHWDHLNELVNNLDYTKDDRWNEFVIAFTDSLSMLFYIDKQLINFFIESKYENPKFNEYLHTYDTVCESAIETIRASMLDMPIHPPKSPNFIGLYPCREHFHTEFYASHLAPELHTIKKDVLLNDDVDNEAKYDITKEATDSVKSFIKRIFRIVPKIESILSTVNEMLSIGRRLTT